MTPNQHLSTRTTRRTRTHALTPPERLEAEQVAQRLHDELRASLYLLPQEKRGASALARVLRIDRATCQRIVACLARGQTGVQALVNLPGILGLRLFVSALRTHARTEADQDTLKAADAAIERFETFLKTIRTSQRGLRALVDELEPVSSHGDHQDPRARQAMYHAALSILGRSSDASVTIRIIKPLVNAPHLTETVNVRALLGHTARAGAVPLEVGNFAHHPGAPNSAMYGALDAKGESNPWGTLLEKFCSRPLPKVVTKRDAFRIIHAIESDQHSDRPMDIVIGSRSAQPEPHPATLNPPIGELSTLIQFPAKKLVFDIFVHADVAARCTPTFQTHLWTPVGSHVIGRWTTKIPGGPELSTLGRGLPPTRSTPPTPRHHELLAHVFDHAGWNPDEFVGYRCVVDYPLWRCAYHAVFDFTEAKG